MMFVQGDRAMNRYRFIGFYTILASCTTIALAQSGWTVISSPTTHNLYAISFADSNIGTAVGDSGTIIRTTDGGVHWVQQSGVTNKNLFGVYLSDSNGVTVVGDSGIILRTNDGGSSWNTHMTEPSVVGVPNYLHSVQMFNTSRGIAVGHITIHRTFDGWNTWTTQISPLPGLNALSFIDTNHGVAAGGGIIRTTNGGLNWTTIWTGGDMNFSGVVMIDSNTFIAVGYTHQSEVILRTTDGGSSWQPQFPGTGGLSTVHFVDRNFGMAVGTFGRIYRTTNSGTDWSIQGSQTMTDLAGVSSVDTNRGVIVGSGGIILRTETGGIVEVEENAEDVINEFTLEQNYPNPFNPSTRVNYRAVTKQHVTLKVYDVLGREIETLVDEVKQQGTYKVEWNASNLPSGIYVCRLVTPSSIAVKKLLLLK